MPIDPGTATVVSAGLKAAGPILGGLFGGGKSGYEKQMQYWNETNAALNNQIQKKLFNERNDPIQRRVKDARLAGLHPLYALGHSANYSPGAFIPGQSVTGSSSGDAIQGIAQGAADAVAGLAGPTNLAKLQERLLQAQIAREEVETQAVASATARAEQEAAAKRVVPAETYGAPERPMAPLTPREVRQEMVKRKQMTMPSPAHIKGPFGMNWRTQDRTWGQALEEVYGESPLNYVYSGAALLEDVMHNMMDRIMRSVYEEDRK